MPGDLKVKLKEEILIEKFKYKALIKPKQGNLWEKRPEYFPDEPQLIKHQIDD